MGIIKRIANLNDRKKYDKLLWDIRANDFPTDEIREIFKFENEPFFSLDEIFKAMGKFHLDLIPTFINHLKGSKYYTKIISRYFNYFMNELEMGRDRAFGEFYRLLGKEVSKQDRKKYLHKLLPMIYWEPNSIKFLYHIVEDPEEKRLIGKIFLNNHPQSYAKSKSSLTILEKDTIKSEDVVVLMFHNYRGIEYGELVKAFDRFTTAAKLTIQRVIFYSYKKKTEFKFDENLQPMDVNLDSLTLDPDDKISALGRHAAFAGDGAQRWANLFADFKIVPLVDYWNKR